MRTQMHVVWTHHQLHKLAIQRWDKHVEQGHQTISDGPL
jgi:hypothetical protein